MSGEGKKMTLDLIKKACLLALLGMAADAALAQKKPTYDEARDLTRRMHRVIAETNLWDKKPLQARIGAIADANKLVDDAERMFGKSQIGDFAQCRNAAIAMKFYVLNLNDLALVLEGRRQVSSSVELLSPAYQGFQFGDAYRACQAEIEVLYVPKAKP